MQVVTSRTSPNNVSISTCEDDFWNLRLGVLREDNSHRKTFKATLAQVGEYTHIFISKEFPWKTYKQTCTGQTAHLLTGLFMTEALVMWVMQAPDQWTPPSLSQPLGCSRSLRRLLLPQRKTRNSSAEWLPWAPFWKVTPFPSSDSVIKPKRSGITIWNYCLWWNGTVKQ